MTTPLESKAYPGNPTLPSAAPQGYVTPASIARNNEPPITSGEIDRIRGDFIELILRKVVEALVGVFVPGGGGAFDQLRDWAENLLEQIPALINSILEILTGSIGATLDDLAFWARNLLTLIRGVIPPWFLPPTHVGRLTDELPPLVSDSGFDQLPEGESEDWFRHATKGRTKPGSACVDANGELHELIARPVAVAAGQKYRVGAWVACEGGVTTPNSVRLQIAEFAGGDDPINIHIVDTWTPTGTQDFVEIFGDYIVPAGVQMVAVTIAVTEDFTDGRLFVDDVTGPSTGLMQMSWVENLVKRWENLAKLFGIVDTDLDGDVDLADIWNTLWSVWLKPLNWIPNVAQNLIDRIINAVENLGNLIDIGLPIGGVLDAIFNIFRTALGANVKNAQLEARIHALETANSTITLDFNGGATSSIGSSYTSGFSGPGNGQMGLDGNGNLMWKPFGVLSRTQQARYNVAPLGTDNCVIKVFLASSPQSYLFDAAYTYINWRMNSAGTSATMLRIGYGEIRLMTVVGGVITTLGSPWFGNPRGGQEIEIMSGDTGDSRHFVVKLGGTQILDVTDTGDISQVGASYRYVGVGMTTGNRLVLFQNIPAGLSVATFSEVT